MIAKRVFDTVFSLLGLVILFPVFVLIALGIRTETPGPVFFRQERVGRFEKTFRIHKFRTMLTDLQDHGLLLTCDGDRRITRFGRILRKYKLDELPQLIDVLLGDMSLVGARPEVPKYVKYYPQKVKAAVLSMRPGITDPASIIFRDENSILAASYDPERDYIENILPAKLRYYEEYVADQSLWGDVVVILKTLKSLFQRAEPPVLTKKR